jgi:hypothetical protein
LAQQFWRLRDAGRIVTYLCASSATDIYYISRRAIGHDRAHDSISRCLAEFGVVSVRRAELETALALPGRDFEDNVLIACAQAARLDMIVTRNVSDFHHATVRVLEPQDVVRVSRLDRW